ncbi:MAG: hypothetical protein NZM25_06525 [Leptospiraceae bacterium]|nr:hypothetical protein [Leptospiraceae bacterium]MDW8306570.1 hypothetical protein [Leptospiraceae bacterium]
MEIRKITQAICDWFSQNKETYFFRENRDPYLVFVSELALQQTRLANAYPILKKFLQHYPDVKSLASAHEQDILSLWAGLGYYRRGRQLREAAHMLLEKYNGQFPSRYEDLLLIPGIGPYTAAMIASLCFSEKILALDGNIKRVLSRLLGIRHEISSRAFLLEVRKVETEIFNYPISPGVINEAFMEFGQKICTVNPQCNICFLSSLCQAYLSAETHHLPKRKKARLREKIFWYALLVLKDNFVLVQKNDTLSLLRHLYILPSFVVYQEQKKEEYSFPKNLLAFSKKPQLPYIRHSIMHYNIYASFYYSHTLTTNLPKEFIWISKDNLSYYLTSSLMRKLVHEARL